MARNLEASTAPAVQPQEPGPWDAALVQLSEWDPAWAATCVKMTSNPWVTGILPRKFIELIGVGLNAACTNLDPDGTRRHIRAALAAGANRDEILLVLKCAAAMSIHSCSLGAPTLLEEAKAAGATAAPKNAAPTPACDKMRAAGQWNTAWDPFLALDPEWTNEFMATAVGIYGSSVLTPKEIELLSIAFDASYTHMYAPGTRRHIKAALKAGATMEEIMEVLKLCVVQGVQACNLGVPILAEEMARSSLDDRLTMPDANQRFLGDPAAISRCPPRIRTTPVTGQAEGRPTGPDASTKLAVERTYIACDRTMLAWVRTATALITFGFSIQQFFRIARQGAEESNRLIGPQEFGLAMIIIGLLALLLATLDHRLAIQMLQARYPTSEQYPKIPRSRARVLAALIAILGILAVMSMLLRH